MRRTALVGISLALLAGAATASGPYVPIGLDVHRPVPYENPLTPEKIALGRRLFDDRRLSRTRTLACSSCHAPSRSFAGRAAVAVGDDAGGVVHRDVPTLINRAWGRAFFWDGRAATLEEQVLQPILNPRELAMRPEMVIELARGRDYGPRFLQAFGVDPDLEHVARALASYVRTIVSGNSRFDRYGAGDRAALSPAARRGLSLFNGKAGCAGCHHGPNFSDEQLHNTGVAWRTGRLTDAGRARVTGRPEDRGAFKTPTLRHVAGTAPYMHDGSVATLRDVVEHYNRGGSPAPGLDVRMRVLNLQPSEKHDIIEFLRALTGTLSDGR
jgi:cytochrome c peroxidase